MASEDFPYAFYPKIFQDPSQGNFCVPICIKIVLDTLQYKVEGIPSLSVDEIAKIVLTESDGTPAGDNIEKINAKLTFTNPEINFFPDYLVSKWDIICKEVSSNPSYNVPIIMIIYQYDTVNLNYFQHAVVLLKANNQFVVYFDPIYGELTEPTSKFYNQWLYTNRTCIRVKINPRAQRMLEEFSKNDGVKK